MTGVVAALVGSRGVIVTVSDTTPTGGGAPGEVTTNVTTASSLPAGASFVWSYVSGDTEIFAVNPNGASTAFRATVAQDQTFQAIWQVVGTVNGQSSAPVQVTVTVAGI